ncbi:hypothetical protein PHPI107946_03030 [Phocicoccus pinnipedialis]|uniref:Uncharacterized protein n=2 Tax=Phocicoccus pinnipedialis TaxID=110845 RepID=A0A6V7R4P4_9BACL|nr:hypothetical protein [Jeotgalicoccus pinnipedialis]CAD2072397.1 hypothetical protein JEOPIN946_00492 [Jeotgalicoccus pinnipedialis]
MILGSAMGWAIIGLFIAIPVYMLLFIGAMAIPSKKKK